MSGVGTDSAAGTNGTADMSGRDLALLRAVAGRRCTLRLGVEPVLLIDGRRCADGSAAWRLITAGLIDRPEPGRDPQPAQLTTIGRAALGL
jgi:hypothetical protein